MWTLSSGRGRVRQGTCDGLNIATIVRHPSLSPLLLGLLVAGCGGRAVSSVSPASNVPLCTEVVGLPNIAVSFDGGKSFAKSRTPREVNAMVVTLLALDRHDALLAVLKGSLFASDDAGCHWKSVGLTRAGGFIEGLGAVA